MVGLVARLAPLMRAGGSFLSLTYMASERVIPGYGGGMSSAKAALESDTRVLAFEAGRKYGVRVNCISAGPLASRAASAIGIIEAMVDYCATNSPLTEPLSPSEVANTAAFLVQPAGERDYRIGRVRGQGLPRHGNGGAARPGADDLRTRFPLPGLGAHGTCLAALHGLTATQCPALAGSSRDAVAPSRADDPRVSRYRSVPLSLRAMRRSARHRRGGMMARAPASARRLSTSLPRTSSGSLPVANLGKPRPRHAVHGQLLDGWLGSRCDGSAASPGQP